MRAESRLNTWKIEYEHLWDMTRIMWATINNRWRTKSEKPYKPQDLIRLSFDKDEELIKPLAPEEVEKKFKKTLKRKNVK